MAGVPSDIPPKATTGERTQQPASGTSEALGSPWLVRHQRHRRHHGDTRIAGTDPWALARSLRPFLGRRPPVCHVAAGVARPLWVVAPPHLARRRAPWTPLRPTPGLRPSGARCRLRSRTTTRLCDALCSTRSTRKLPLSARARLGTTRPCHASRRTECCLLQPGCCGLLLL